MSSVELQELHTKFMRALNCKAGYSFEDGFGGLRAEIHRIIIKYELIRRAHEGCALSMNFAVCHRWPVAALKVAA